LEEFEMKEGTVSIKEEILPGSTVEDTCTVYVQGAGSTVEDSCTVYVQGAGSTVEDTCTVFVQGESIKRESVDIKSKKQRIIFQLNKIYFNIFARYYY